MGEFTPTVYEKMSKEDLKNLYDEYKNLFVKIEKNYGKFMYTIISRMVLIGKKLDKRYTIKHNLCKDLGITYERYKFYSKYRHISADMQKMIDDNEIRPIAMMNIVHRYPKQDWKDVIDLERKYKLTHHDLIELKKDDKYKDEVEWDRIYQEKAPLKKHMVTKTNRRALTNHCIEIQNKLHTVMALTPKVKAQIYQTVFDTYNVMGDWLAKHKKWDRPELLDDEA